MEYDIVIGLEVHAELSTKSKIYCSCPNEFGLEVNTRCCPICSGMPGTLPTLNEKVVDYAVKMGYALNCKINPISKQDRKNYFYPDLPKAYQISQFDIPLCGNGYLDLLIDGEKKRIGVTRIHIEEDAGKLLHNDSFSGSLVDFNRCGVPLIEIVSEPDMRTPKEAKAYLDTIKQILQYLDISDCKMQEGSIRCDVNVSVMEKGSKTFGTRCEMKNVNTFSGAMRAIEFESNRQIKIIEAGGTISQETRRWDDAKGESFTLRSKENAHDYRYFPEPDLKTIVISETHLREIYDTIPELPNMKLMRYVKDYDLTQVDANLLIEYKDKAAFFEECVKIGGVKYKTISNWILINLTEKLNEKNIELSELKITPQQLVELIKMIENGNISNSNAKIVLDEILLGNDNIDEIIKAKGLTQISDDNALNRIVQDVLLANAKSVEDFKNGKTNAFGFLVGQCMKASKGQGNPSVMKELLTTELNK